MKRLSVCAVVIAQMVGSMVPSLAEDEASVAQKLLYGAFACPTAPRTEYECDAPVTRISRSTFSGDSSVFRVTTETKIISSNLCGLLPGGALRDVHRSNVYSGNFSDVARSEISSYQVPMGDHSNVQRVLVLYCRSGLSCFRDQSQQDFGSDRTQDQQAQDLSFEFCDDDELQNAKAAVDILIASAPKVALRGAQRSVKSSVQGGHINLREGPGLDQNVVAEIPAGESIVVDEATCRPGSDGRTKYPFCRVTWNSYAGWASASGFE